MIKELLLIILTFLAGCSLAFIFKGHTDSQIESIRIILNALCSKIDENVKTEFREVSYICNNDKIASFFIFILFLAASIFIAVFESSNPLILFFLSSISFLAGFFIMYYYFLV